MARGNKERKISSLILQYRSTSRTNASKVIYCFDCDDYDKKIEDMIFLQEAKQYCDDRKYDFVWFCKDIERVYLGKKVDDSNKKKEAEIFKARKQICTIDTNKLSVVNYQMNTSNLMRVLDQYLARRVNP